MSATRYDGRLFAILWVYPALPRCGGRVCSRYPHYYACQALSLALPVYSYYLFEELVPTPFREHAASNRIMIKKRNYIPCISAVRSGHSSKLVIAGCM